MKFLHSFRMKLILYMLIMAGILVSVMGALQYISQYNVLEKNKNENQALLEKKCIEAVNYIDNFYGLYSRSSSEKMLQAAERINKEYEQKKDIEKIDLNKIKKEFGIDIYFINVDNKIVMATNKTDIGLDFKGYKGFSKWLDSVRSAGVFAIDGMSITVISRDLKLFAYYPTKDKQYIIETGMDLRSDSILAGKNIDSELEKIKNASPSIESINIFFSDGRALNKVVNGLTYQIQGEYLDSLTKAIKTKERQLLTKKQVGHMYTYTYLPFNFKSYESTGRDVAIEIKFNNYSFENALSVNRKISTYMVVFSIFLALAFAYFASRFISKPLSAMAEGISDITSGNLVYLAELKSKDEFHILNDSFNNMVSRIRNLLEEIQSNYLSTVKALANAIEASDTYTKGHCERVTRIAIDIGKEMGLPENDLIDLEFAGLLHDIGKIGIHEAVLNKNGGLTEEEFQMIKMHPEIGYKILEGVEFLERSRTILRQHHERIDGTGYPLHKKSEEILVESKILAVADAYDAMTSARPYREVPLTAEQAARELKRFGGIQFDNAVVSIFLEMLQRKEYFA